MSRRALEVPLAAGAVGVVGPRVAGALDGTALADVGTSACGWKEQEGRGGD